MATDLQNLQTRYSAVCADLARVATFTGSFVTDEAGSKRKISYEDYRLKLYEELRQLKEAIQFAQGPFEVTSQGI